MPAITSHGINNNQIRSVSPFDIWETLATRTASVAAIGSTTHCVPPSSRLRVGRGSNANDATVGAPVDSPSTAIFAPKKYHAGELTPDAQREEELVETAQHIAAPARKVGQFTKELDLPKRVLIAAPATSSGRSLIISGPAVSAPGEDVA